MTPVDKAFLDDVLSLIKTKHTITDNFVIFDGTIKVFIQIYNITRYNRAFMKTSLPRERFIEEAVNYIKGIIADAESEDNVHDAKA